MPKVRVTEQNVNFRDDEGKIHQLRKGAPYDLDEKHLGHWFVQAHVKSGNLVVVNEKNQNAQEVPIEELTIAQLQNAIKAIKEDFDFSGCKKKADYVEALKSLKAEGSQTE